VHQAISHRGGHQDNGPRSFPGEDYSLNAITRKAHEIGLRHPRADRRMTKLIDFWRELARAR
jgi:hypothetical protein